MTQTSKVSSKCQILKTKLIPPYLFPLERKHTKLLLHEENTSDNQVRFLDSEIVSIQLSQRKLTPLEPEPLRAVKNFLDEYMKDVDGLMIEEEKADKKKIKPP